MPINPYESPEECVDVAVPVLRSGAVFKAWIVFFLLSYLTDLVLKVVLFGGLGMAIAAKRIGPHSMPIVMLLGNFLIWLPVSYFWYRFSVRIFLAPRERKGKRRDADHAAGEVLEHWVQQGSPDPEREFDAQRAALREPIQ